MSALLSLVTADYFVCFDFNHRPWLITYKHNYRFQQVSAPAFIMWDEPSIARRPFFSVTTSIRVHLPHRGDVRHGGYYKWLTDVPSEKQMFDLLCGATAAHVSTVSMRNDLWRRKQKYQEMQTSRNARNTDHCTAPLRANGASITHHHVPGRVGVRLDTYV